MSFDCTLGDTEHVSDLLIRQAAHDEYKDLALSWRQALKTCVPLPLFAPGFTIDSATVKRTPYRLEQVVSPNGLGKETYGSSFHRSYRGGNIAVTRQKNHWHWFFPLSQSFLQLKAAGSRHLEIEHRAPGRIPAPPEELLSRTEAFDLVTFGSETSG